MLQQYHWIIGWWQPRCERPLSFVEDDKLRPGEDVTSGSRRCRSFWKFRSKIRNVRYQTSTFKMADPAGTKTVEEAKKRQNRSRKTQPTTQERECPRCHHPEGVRIRNSAIWQQKDRVLAEKCQMRPLCPEDEEWCQRQEADDRHRTVTVYFIGAYPHLLWLFIVYLDNVWPTRASF